MRRSARIVSFYLPALFSQAALKVFIIFIDLLYELLTVYRHLISSLWRHERFCLSAFEILFVYFYISGIKSFQISLL